MIIGIITPTNLLDKQAWSGIPYFASKEIKNSGHEVVELKTTHSRWAKILIILSKIVRKLLLKEYSLEHIGFVAKHMASSIDVALLEKVDIIFTPGNSNVVAYLKTNKPIIYFTDATFNSIYNYYKGFDNFTSFDQKKGEQIDTLALNRANHIITASDWAYRSVVDHYHISPNKVSVIEFGANLEHSIQYIPKTAPTEKRIHLIFVGVNWERKGGETAVKACEELINRGYQATIKIIGIRNLSPKIANLPYVKNFGMLRKSNKEEFLTLEKAFQESHILLLPTKAECAGIVFSEAACYGLPSVTYNTGGVGNYVIDGLNGHKLNYPSSPSLFADKIEEILRDYEMISQKSRDLYLSKLNWERWGKKITIILRAYSQTASSHR